MMNVSKILEHETQFRALTSLNIDEFETLLRFFRHRWHQFHKHYNVYGRRRKRVLSAKAYLKPTRTLPSVEDKLFFILLFFKTGSIQQQLAANFEMDQSQVSRWIKLLLPLLHESIVDCHCQAAQTMEELIQLFRQRQGPPNSGDLSTTPESLHLDVTARPIAENIDRSAQKKDFSAKHHGHRLKNTLICDEFQFIHFAGPTWLGSMHDKTIINLELPSLNFLKSYELWLSKDKGYQKYQPFGVHLLEPIRNPPKGEMSDFEKEYNTWVNSIRVIIEHAISGVKRLQLLAQPHRYHNAKYRNDFFQIGCGLHNLRVRFRRHNYSRGASRIRASLNF